MKSKDTAFAIFLIGLLNSLVTYTAITVFGFVMTLALVNFATTIMLLSLFVAAVGFVVALKLEGE